MAAGNTQTDVETARFSKYKDLCMEELHSQISSYLNENLQSEILKTYAPPIPVTWLAVTTEEDEYCRLHLSKEHTDPLAHVFAKCPDF